MSAQQAKASLHYCFSFFPGFQATPRCVNLYSYIPHRLFVTDELLIGDVKCLRFPVIESFLGHYHLDVCLLPSYEVTRLEISDCETFQVLATRTLHCLLSNANGLRHLSREGKEGAVLTHCLSSVPLSRFYTSSDLYIQAVLTKHESIMKLTVALMYICGFL